jgi:hypothetical protein
MLALHNNIVLVSTITDILKEKERWLAISESQGSVKKFRGLK